VIAPSPQACHNCGHAYAGAVCPICKEDRPAYTALKALSAKLRAALPECRYYPDRNCECGARGECLPVA
jgi:hypothetical protein